LKIEDLTLQSNSVLTNGLGPDIFVPYYRVKLG
jgi:hypothetical protein